MKAKYLHPFTSFGFKRIFGEEASRPILLDFLNALLGKQSNLIDITLKSFKNELYVFYCRNESGEELIVELQKAELNFFKDRATFYSTFPISELEEKGDWNYNLKAVYCIGILDFTFDDYATEPEKSEVVHTVKLKDQNGKTFYNKLTYIYLEMPNFKKSADELVTRLDKWLFFIKNLEDFQAIPQIFSEEIVFVKAFEKAELAKLNQTEIDSYEYSLKIFRDLKNTYDYAVQTAREEGMKEGMREGMREGEIKGKIEVAKELKRNGISIEVIALSTGLSKDEIENLKT